MFCPECGSRIDDEYALFCEECGTRVRDEVPETPEAPSAESQEAVDGKSDFDAAGDVVGGLILTNLTLLAAKLRVPVSSLEKLLQQYIDGKRGGASHGSSSTQVTILSRKRTCSAWGALCI